MTRRDLSLLFLLGLVVSLFVAYFQSLPGYMDADYYFGGGLQLVRGKGFTEPYLWNYLSNPQTLPAPSHAYWMPLASILAAAGMWLTGKFDFFSARLGFILSAALVPVATALLAFRLTSNRVLSLLSGLLACFSIYYAPFLPVTDNYAIYMLIGSSFFILLFSLQSSAKNSHLIFFTLGLLSALASLARSDGLLWLGISLLVVVWHANRVSPIRSFPQFVRPVFRFSFFVFLGFFVLMSPWYAHNLSAFGTLMAPGGSRALWLTNYNDTFAYPASRLTMQSWLASGWSAILQARLVALRTNLLNAVAAQGGIFLFPFILIGLWIFRRDVRVRFAALAWILLLVAMTVIFPFAGPRGAFFHAGAALQPMWWSLAPVGLDALIRFAREKGLFDDRAFVVFRSALVGLAALMTAVIFVVRVLPGWEREDGIYRGMNDVLVQAHIPADAVVMVRNPPGFYLVTGHPAIAIPVGGQQALLAVAKRYHARYLVMEPLRVDPTLYGFQLDQYPSFSDSNGNRLYEILP